MSNVNKVVLTGNLTRDPEVKFLASGNAVCNFGLAVGRKYKTDDGMQDDVSFVDCVTFGRQAEIFGEYLSKGKKVAVVGRLKQDSWEDAEGNKRSRLNVVVEDFEMLSPKDAEASERPKQEKGNTPRKSQNDEEPMPF